MTKKSKINTVNLRATLVVLTIFLGLIGCKSTKQLLESHNRIEIVAGKGFGDFQINSTDTSAVIEKLGSNFIDTTYLYPSRQLKYDQYGVSFVYRQDNDTIWNIIFYAPFNGFTDHGIILNKSTMKDVESAYGDLWWQIGHPFSHWSSMYPGIEYQVEKEGVGNDFPLDKSKHIDKVITQIEVFNNDHFYDENGKRKTAPNNK
jgi:hypothetical protein